MNDVVHLTGTKREKLLKLLQLRRTEAFEYARTSGLDKWGVFITWAALTQGPIFARYIAGKYNKQSPAWAAYHRLVDAGILAEGPHGGLATDHRDPSSTWAGEIGAMLWFNAVARAAAGEPIDPRLPRH